MPLRIVLNVFLIVPVPVIFAREELVPMDVEGCVPELKSPIVPVPVLLARVLLVRILVGLRVQEP
jgi:hypothetical protein